MESLGVARGIYVDCMVLLISGGFSRGNSRKFSPAVLGSSIFESVISPKLLAITSSIPVRRTVRRRSKALIRETKQRWLLRPYLYGGLVDPCDVPTERISPKCRRNRKAHLYHKVRRLRRKEEHSLLLEAKKTRITRRKTNFLVHQKWIEARNKLFKFMYHQILNRRLLRFEPGPRTNTNFTGRFGRFEPAVVDELQELIRNQLAAISARLTDAHVVNPIAQIPGWIRDGSSRLHRYPDCKLDLYACGPVVARHFAKIYCKTSDRLPGYFISYNAVARARTYSRLCSKQMTKKHRANSHRSKMVQKRERRKAYYKRLQVWLAARFESRMSRLSRRKRMATARKRNDALVSASRSGFNRDEGMEMILQRMQFIAALEGTTVCDLCGFAEDYCSCNT